MILIAKRGKRILVYKLRIFTTKEKFWTKKVMEEMNEKATLSLVSSSDNIDQENESRGDDR